MTVFDARDLESLALDVDNRPFMLSFAACYCRLLPGRVQRIVTAMLSTDLDEAMDAALSLKVASRTTGTHELSELAGTIEQHLRRGDLAAAHADARLLPSVSERAERAVMSFVGDGQTQTDSIR